MPFAVHHRRWWARKLLANPKKADGGTADVRVAAVEAVLGSDWVKYGRGMRGEWGITCGDTLVWVDGLHAEPLAKSRK